MQLPSRTTLSDSGLDNLYEIVKQKISEIDQHNISCIKVMFDGWSSRKELPMLAFVLLLFEKIGCTE